MSTKNTEARNQRLRKRTSVMCNVANGSRSLLGAVGGGFSSVWPKGLFKYFTVAIKFVGRSHSLKTFLLNFLKEISLRTFCCCCWLQRFYPCSNTVCQRRTMPLPHKRLLGASQAIYRDSSLTSQAEGHASCTSLQTWRGTGALIFPLEWQWKLLCW